MECRSYTMRISNGSSFIIYIISVTIIAEMFTIKMGAYLGIELPFICLMVWRKNIFNILLGQDQN